LDSLSIVIPAYNEAARLPPTLDAVCRYLAARPWRFAEILVVDDGSTDGTGALVAEAAKQDPLFRLLRNPGNRGKGYSVRHGVLEARGDWVLFTDADLSTPIEEMEKLRQAVCGGRALIAIGSRAIDRTLIEVHQPGLRESAGHFFNLFMRLVTGLPFRDTQCGFKLFEARAAREVFRRQVLNGFGFDVEALYIARKLGYPIAEVPVRWSDVAGTKVSLARGIDAFADLLRVRRNDWLGRYR
jgi:glycosyltransferase involved in cell wall biosynthesis